MHRLTIPPRDPASVEADLIDDVARSLREAHDMTSTWGDPDDPVPDFYWDRLAREILAKVRGAQA